VVKAPLSSLCMLSVYDWQHALVGPLRVEHESHYDPVMEKRSAAASVNGGEDHRRRSALLHCGRPDLEVWPMYLPCLALVGRELVQQAIVLGAGDYGASVVVEEVVVAGPVDTCGGARAHGNAFDESAAAPGVAVGRGDTVSIRNRPRRRNSSRECRRR